MTQEERVLIRRYIMRGREFTSADIRNHLIDEAENLRGAANPISIGSTLAVLTRYRALRVVRRKNKRAVYILDDPDKFRGWGVSKRAGGVVGRTWRCIGTKQ